jgi:dihydrofolate synthase/folylpolyglutamate synthase
LLEEKEGQVVPSFSGEKAGILKPGVGLVSGVKNDEVRDFMSAKQREMAAACDFLGRDFRLRRSADGSFSYFGVENKFAGLQITMPGRHQQDNAALALRALESLSHEGLFEIDPDLVAAALLKVTWPGRLQKVASSPDIYLDGAHNPHGIRALEPELKRLKGDRRLVLLLGVMKDKRIKEMTSKIAPLADEIIVTQAPLDRACLPERLAEEVKAYCPMVTVTDSVADALTLARERAGAEDLIFLTGSLYCVGEAFNVLDLPVM